MCAGALVNLSVPGLACPVDSVLGRILVKTLPPDGVVIKIEGNVGEDGTLLCCKQSVRVGLHVGTRSNAEEAVFGVDCVKSAVLALADPGDIVAYAPDLVALLGVNLGRNEHCKVGLSAG